MGGCFSREPIQGRDEELRRTRSRQLMTLHQILREEEIANCREDRGKQDSDGRLTLVEQSPNQREGALQITRSKRITQLEDDSGARHRHHGTDILRGEPPVLLPAEKVELLELAVDGSRVAA